MGKNRVKAYYEAGYIFSYVAYKNTNQGYYVITVY